MKRIIRHYIIATFALWAVSKIAQGITFENYPTSLFVAGIGLTIAMVVARPVINILILPLNLVSFGLFRWVSSAVALYLVTLVVSDFKVTGFQYGGVTSKWFDIPELNFTGIFAYVGFSLLLSVLTSFIYWVRK